MTLLCKGDKMSGKSHCKVSLMCSDSSYKMLENLKYKWHNWTGIHKYHWTKGTYLMDMLRRKIHCSDNKVLCTGNNCLRLVHNMCHRRNCIAHKYHLSDTYLDPNSPFCKYPLPNYIRFDTQGIQLKYC